MSGDQWAAAARRLLAEIGPGVPVTDELVAWVRQATALDDGIVVAADGTIVGRTFHLGRYGRTASAWYVTAETWTRHDTMTHTVGLEVGLALGQIRHSTGLDVAHIRPADARAALSWVRGDHARAQHAAQLAELADGAAAGDEGAAAKLARMASNGDRAAAMLADDVIRSRGLYVRPAAGGDD